MRLALHSISYAGLWGQATFPIEPILDKAVQLGYEGVMLVAKRPHASPLDLDAEARRRLAGEIQRHGLQLAAVAGYTDFCAGHDHLDVPLREAQILYVGEIARMTRDLGGNLVRIFTGFGRPGISHDQAWEWVVSSVRECAQRAADVGVTIGVQNHHDLAVHHDSLRDLLRDVDHPNCRACFDAWAPATQGVDLRDAAQEMAPFTALTTVADYVQRRRYTYDPAVVNYTRDTDVLRAVSMGEGFIDYPSFFAGLRAGGYPEDGWASYEMCSPLAGGGSEANLDVCARQFVTWMGQHCFAKQKADDLVAAGARR